MTEKEQAVIMIDVYTDLQRIQKAEDKEKERNLPPLFLNAVPGLPVFSSLHNRNCYCRVTHITDGFPQVDEIAVLCIAEEIAVIAGV